MEAQRDINCHKERLDKLTDDILARSTSILEKIEENIRLTHTLRLSSAMITQMDTRIDLLTHNLNQYQVYLTQLNSLMLRSEFFESQLRMLEAEQQVNAMRTRRGLPGLHNWKDEEMNWRTVTATLENLFLEYGYLSKKIEQLSTNDMKLSTLPLDTSSLFTFEDTTFTPPPMTPQQVKETVDEVTPLPGKTLQEKVDTNVRLKPIRCSSTKSDTSVRRTSLNLSINLLTKNVITTPQKYQDQLLTPDTTMDETMISQSSVAPAPQSSELSPSPPSTRTRSATRKHTRCKSSPLALKDFHLSPPSTDTLISGLPMSKFNLRHFISHDTGLQTKLEQQEAESEDENGVKDSQFVNSPDSLKIDGYLQKRIEEATKSITAEEKCHTVDEASVIYMPKRENSLASPAVVSPASTLSPAAPSASLAHTPASPVVETFVDEHRYQLPTFEHKLNRSNSCDSIFSVMTSRIPVQPGKDPRSQTLLWMQTFSKPPKPTTSGAPGISTVTANNLTVSARGAVNTKQVLSNLVSQSRRPEPRGASTTTTTNAFSSWFSSSKKTPTAPKTVTATKPDEPVFGSNFFSSFLNPKTKAKPSKLTPQSMLKPNNMVTSEVGKRSDAGSGAWNVPARENIKGSFSTLTIGPHGSKIIQHGESSSMGQSLVVTSRVSHAALKDALTNDLAFD